MSAEKLTLIVGLGNPGPSYIETRHNAGQWFVEAIAKSYNITLATNAKYFGLYGKGVIENRTVHLLIPTTFMNKSGQSVAALCQFFKIPPEQILVAHDELDFEPGLARIKHEGGHGGHNGLRDIISRLGNSKNFHRLRIGIGHPGQARDVSNYVLKKAPSNEQDKILASIDHSLHHLPDIISGNWAQAMNRIHSFKA